MSLTAFILKQKGDDAPRDFLGNIILSQFFQPVYKWAEYTDPTFQVSVDSTSPGWTIYTGNTNDVTLIDFSAVTTPTVTYTGDLTIDGNLEVTGNLTVTGNVFTTTDNSTTNDNKLNTTPIKK